MSLVNGLIFRVKKSFLNFIDPILGHPVYQFLQKPDFSDFTVSGSGLPMGHRFRKYISLCWSNSYFMANARGRRDSRGFCQPFVPCFFPVSILLFSSKEKTLSHYLIVDITSSPKILIFRLLAGPSKKYEKEEMLRKGLKLSKSKIEFNAYGI